MGHIPRSEFVTFIADFHCLKNLKILFKLFVIQVPSLPYNTKSIPIIYIHLCVWTPVSEFILRSANTVLNSLPQKAPHSKLITHLALPVPLPSPLLLGTWGHPGKGDPSRKGNLSLEVLLPISSKAPQRVDYRVSSATQRTFKLLLKGKLSNFLGRHSTDNLKVFPRLPPFISLGTY